MLLVLYLFVFVILCHLTDADVIEVKECKPVAGATFVKPIVDIEGCTAAPCPFKRGTSVKISYTFPVEQDVTNLNYIVIGVVMGMAKGFPGLDNTNACNNLFLMPEDKQVPCPLTKGNTYRVEYIVPVKSFYPPMAVVVRSGVSDKATKKPVACWEMDAKIV